MQRELKLHSDPRDKYISAKFATKCSQTNKQTDVWREGQSSWAGPAGWAPDPEPPMPGPPRHSHQGLSGKFVKYHCPENMLIVPRRLVLAPDRPVGIRAAPRRGTEKRPSRCLCQKPPHCPQGHSHRDAVAGSPGRDDAGLTGLPGEETGSAPGKPETPQANNHNRRNCEGY